MKFKELIEKLNKELSKNPDLADLDVFHWSEHDEAYIGFDNLFKYHKKGFIENTPNKRSSLGEDEVCYTVKEYNEFFCTNAKKEDLKQIVLL